MKLQHKLCMKILELDDLVSFCVAGKSRRREISIRLIVQGYFKGHSIKVTFKYVSF